MWHISRVLMSSVVVIFQRGKKYLISFVIKRLLMYAKEVAMTCHAHRTHTHTHTQISTSTLSSSTTCHGWRESQTQIRRHLKFTFLPYLPACLSLSLSRSLFNILRSNSHLRLYIWGIEKECYTLDFFFFGFIEET